MKMTLPRDWKITTLGEVLSDYKLGGNYENSEADKGLPLIKMGNIDRGKIKLDKIERIPEDLEFDPNDILNEGDFLFNTRNTLDLVGKVSVWRNELPRAVYNSNLLKLSFNETFVDSTYFMNYVFNSSYGIKQLRRYATGTTSVAAIYTKDLLKFKVLLPPLPEQQKIADILSTVDEKIELIDQQIAETEALKRGLMQRLLTKGIGHTEFKDSPVGRVPNNWEITKIGSLLEKIVGGGTPSRDNPDFWNGEIPWATVKDLKGDILNNTQEFITYKGIIGSSANLIPKGTLITSTRMALGKAVFFTMDVAINQDLKALFPKKDLDKQFLFHWFCHNAEAILNLGSGSTVKGIRLEVLRSIDFALPKLTEQDQISSILNNINEKSNILHDKKEEYSILKQGLMQQLLTGEIRVNTLVEA